MPSEHIPLHLRKASADLDWKTRFRIIAAKASPQNRNSTVYSITEEPIKEELLRMGFVEGSTFIHEHRLFGYYGKKGQRVYYWLDFYLPDLKLGIEADGEVWHHFFEIKKRDKKRDRTLSSEHGIKIVRFTSFDVRRKRLRRKLLRVMMRRNLEITQRSKSRVYLDPPGDSTNRDRENQVISINETWKKSSGRTATHSGSSRFDTPPKQSRRRA